MGQNQTFCFGNDFWKSAGNSRNRLTGVFGQVLHTKTRYLKMNKQLRLRAMSVDGFKSLNDFHIRFQRDATVLIGANGSGKSTLLQFFGFLHTFISGDPMSFFEQRKWSKKQVKSHFSRNYNVRAELLFERFDGTQISWKINWGIHSNLNLGETLSLPDQDMKIFTSTVRGRGKRRRQNIKINNTYITGVRFSGSVFTVLELDEIADEEHRAIAEEVYRWGRGIFSLELMSPGAMRGGTRGTPYHIGHRGELLGGFLSGLSPVKKNRIIKRLNRFYPGFEALHATRKRAGWIDLSIIERFSDIRIHAPHMSDGFLRLMALATLPEFSNEITLILLDEIEDGIDPHILFDLPDEISREQGAQLIITSHSPVLVNMFKPEEICFIARAADGPSISAGFDEIPEIQEDIEYQGAGEIWLHTSEDTIETWVRNAVASGTAQNEPEAS